MSGGTGADGGAADDARDGSAAGDRAADDCPARGAVDDRPGVGADGAVVDPDVDLHDAAQRAETAGRRGPLLLAAVAAGGALGACARHGAEVALPARGAGGGPGSGAPWAILLVNVAGCALIGVLMVLVSEGVRAQRTHPLVRPFLGVGVLGGFTTFSTYAVDGVLLLEGGRAAAGTALTYLAGTLLGSLAAVWAAAAGTRALLARRPGVASAP